MRAGTGGSLLNPTGVILVNVLTGKTAVNVITGAAGADTQDGGNGSDVYMVASQAD